MSSPLGADNSALLATARIEPVAVEEGQELVGDRDIVEVGEGDVGVALEAHRRQEQDLDLTGRIKFPDANGADRYEIFASVNNLFDKGQPKQLRLFGNGLYYDSIGQNFKLGVRARF